MAISINQRRRKMFVFDKLTVMWRKYRMCLMIHKFQQIRILIHSCELILWWKFYIPFLCLKYSYGLTNVWSSIFFEKFSAKEYFRFEELVVEVKYKQLVVKMKEERNNFMSMKNISEENLFYYFLMIFLKRNQRIPMNILWSYLSSQM